MPKFSQVFLKDAVMCERIASVLKPEGYGEAVEIGPGRGALTEFLRPQWGEQLTAVEIDPLMAARVKERFPGLRIVNSDFLALDLETFFRGEPGRGPAAFIGNLPYECSTAILMKVLAFSRFGAAVFMFQREVARKITAETGDPDYGYLSVAVRAQSEAVLVADVPAASFSPVPEVDSSVLAFKPVKAFPSAAERDEFLSFVKSAFSHRRKTLMNSLAMGRGMEKSAVEALIRSAGLDPGLRPQNLSVGDYLKLFSVFAAASR